MNTEQPLVSIIIPTYNRAHLIGETLDSILAQTYTHWECIIVDDGSSDNTDEVVGKYLKKDPRFTYFHRPDTHLPGGNGARNYGFLQSKGEYIQWFDSDDLMHPEKLEKKIVASNHGNIDFVISKTKYFNRPNHQPYEYFYSDNDITFLKYSISNVSWFTPDMFIKRNIAIDVSFNEFLKAGQEYNYSCKLLLHVKTAKKVDEFLTFRRYHDESIGKKRQIDKDHYYTTKFQAHWFAYLDISNLYFIQEFNRYSLLECISYYLRSRNSITLPQGFMEELKKVFKNKVLYFHLAKLSNRLFGRYHFFYKKLKQN